jgi:hypothetical protein
MTPRTGVSAPPGWHAAVCVDSRLEADLAAHMLAARDIAAEVVELGAREFAVYVAEDDRATATAVLDVK